MTLMIDLTPEEERLLARKAEQTGRNADALAREAVLEMLRHDDDGLADDIPAPGESLYDALKDQIGGFHSGGDGTLSQNAGEAFTEHLREKKRAGRL